jgi:hypothetical protein
MPELLLHLQNFWHLWAVAGVIVVISLHFVSQFMAPALRLKARLESVNQQLAALSQLPAGTPVDLLLLKTEVMTTPALQNAWLHYARSLQPQWQADDAGPLGVARRRISEVSRAFFAHMGVSSVGGRVDLSNIELMAQSDAHLAQLWQAYNQAMETLAHLESSGHSAVGQWQADAHAENYFTEQALVDSPLASNFFKHVPGILTGVGIIGTFSGLIVGLVGFDVSDPNRVQAELSQLVQAVGLAFLVSAVAIALAMVFTWVEKSLLTGRYRQVEQLQQGLDTLFSPQGSAQSIERLTLAMEMQTVLSRKILSQLSAADGHARAPHSPRP